MRFLKRLAAATLGTLLAGPAAAHVAVPAIGFHTDQGKQVIVYSGAQGGSFSVKDAKTGAVVHTGQLAPVKDAQGNTVPCQGGQPCVMGDFSGVRRPGTYRVEVAGERSLDFPIARNVFLKQAPTMGEFFEALRQQGSTYHANLRTKQNPAFPDMGDGSPVMTAHMSATTTMRLADAYQRNPAFFKVDRYGRRNAPDIGEHIVRQVGYLRGLQDHIGSLAVPEGWLYDFSCPPTGDPAVPQYTRRADPCMRFDKTTSARNTLETMLAFAQAIPVVRAVEGKAAAQSLLDRTLRMRDHVRSTLPSIDGQDAAAYGASLFILSDITGNAAYLREAHALRDRVPTGLNVIGTHPDEFYLAEFARHRQEIERAGLDYAVGGMAPEQLLVRAVERSWVDGKHPIAQQAEQAYFHDIDWGYHISEMMAGHGMLAVRALAYSSSPLVRMSADRQLQWLTGMNGVQAGSDGGQVVSRSFIYGIGQNARNQHTRLVSPTFFDQGMTFRNGKRFIAGWVDGARDAADPDRILNAGNDAWGEWTYREAKNETVATVTGMLAYMDAAHNPRAGLPRRL